MDRTQEFKSCVASIRSRTATTQRQVPEHKQRLLAGYSNSSNQSDKQRKSPARGEFARLAGGIGRDIQQTALKLSQLAQLAKRKTLFDDRPVEISELTYIIKQDIAQLNQQIAQLQSFVKQNLNSRGSKQPIDEHNNNVVMMLQSKLADTSMGFKDVLEIRTQNMKATRDRTEQFQYNNPSLVGAPQSDSPLYSATSNLVAGSSALNRSAYGGSKGKGKSANDSSNFAEQEFLALNMGANSVQGDSNEKGQEGYMQMQLTQNNSEVYLQQRSTAIESIESTITELGSIFSQLAQMVAQQGEQVQRIDQDTIDIESNIQSAQSELLKFYSSISGNRMLMLKVFGIIIIFFLVSFCFLFK
ncbi:syntaxin 5 [Phakopsora pachyrhizi]|uniref:Syntaxin 5 n=1 Tax=Phakopsora pachyrhizi TaxID=170000 RepID=A0AAV0B039_PHAPC|nr:syntaxin 5 [Phakopsora pachyrhizi]